MTKDETRNPWWFIGIIAAGDDATKTKAEELTVAGGFIVRARDQPTAIAIGAANKFIELSEYQCLSAAFPVIAGKKIDPSMVNRSLTAEEAKKLQASKENRAAIMIDDDGIEPPALPEKDLSQFGVDLEDVTNNPLKNLFKNIFGELGDHLPKLPAIKHWEGGMITIALKTEGEDFVHGGFQDSEEIMEKMLTDKTLETACKMVDLGHLLAEHSEICDDPAHPFLIPDDTLAIISEALIIAAHRITERLKTAKTA